MGHASALLRALVDSEAEFPSMALQQSSPLFLAMCLDGAGADLDHVDVKEEFSIQAPPVPHDMASHVSDKSALTLTGRKIPYTLRPEPKEIWMPLLIHTAKCDRCQEHNRSVIQRSSRSNKQFCKGCMHLNVEDGLCDVDVESLDWNSQATANKLHTRGATKPRKSPKIEKAAASTTPAKATKRQREDSKGPANKRIRFSRQSERETRIENSLFVEKDDSENEEKDTKVNVDFDRYLHNGFLPSEAERKQTYSAEVTQAAGGVSRPRSTDEIGQRSKTRNEKMKLKVSDARGVESEPVPRFIPWWEKEQAPLSNVRDEAYEKLQGNDFHFGPIKPAEVGAKVVTEASTEVVAEDGVEVVTEASAEVVAEADEAAKILQLFQQDPRGYSGEGVN